MMTEHEYTQEVLRTCAEPDHLQRLILGAMGLAGESGEVVDVIKKTHIQGHALDVEKLIDELGMCCGTLLCSVTRRASPCKTCASAMSKSSASVTPNGFEVAQSLNHKG